MKKLLFLLLFFVSFVEAYTIRDLYSALKSNNIKTAKAIVKEKPHLITKYFNYKIQDKSSFLPKDASIFEIQITMLHYIALCDLTAVDYAFFLETALSLDGPSVYSLRSRPSGNNVKHFVGETPLHFAARFLSIEYVQILLREGADIDAVNVLGQTPLMVMMLTQATYSFGIIDSSPKKEVNDTKKLIILNLLLHYGACISSFDQYGNTALSYACLACHFDVVKALALHPNPIYDTDIEYAQIIKYMLDRFNRLELIEPELLAIYQATAQNIFDFLRTRLEHKKTTPIKILSAEEIKAKIKAEYKKRFQVWALRDTLLQG